MMPTTISMVIDSPLTLSGGHMGFDWAGSWVFLGLVFLLAPCIPIVVRATAELLESFTRRAKRGQPALVIVRRAMLKSS
jgi:hypothetical protein